jgi:predicted DCC family thiol-disulfide oxidoreductase YuxK
LPQVSVNTELPEVNDTKPWVLYDGECRLCLDAVERLRPLFRHYGFGVAPLQLPWVRARLGIPDGAPLTEMALLTPDGRRFGGADAILKSADYIWWAWPFAHLATLLGLRPLLRVIYRHVAARRHCWNRACHVDVAVGRTVPGEPRLGRDASPYRRIAGWPMVLLPIIALIAALHSPPWVMMWATAFSLWLGCKWLMLWHARPLWPRTTAGRVMAFMFAWPGMNAGTFLAPNKKSLSPSASELVRGVTRMGLGMFLLWGLARAVVGTSPILAGWLGLIGMVLLLHFGLFDLLGWMLRRAGVAAPPLMNRPARSTSVAEFWGRRWNLAFHELVKVFVFEPLRRRFGRSAARCGVFLASGIIHELVISVPARGGYGLPTAYFAIQAVALFIERSKVGRRLGLTKGWRGWLFTFAVTVLPAYWLFHPQFLQVVILPFMEAIGAL